MRITQQLSRVLALSALTAMLAACGGGGGGSSQGLLPTGPSGPNKTAPKANAYFKATLPSPTGSSSKRPNYISSNGTSSLVVSVTPADPAEAAQWASTYGVSSFSVCYNIFTSGAVASPLATGVVVTVGPPVTVSFPFPSPPGQDSFIISQYAGACSATDPYAPPTPGPGQTAAQTIISQSPALVLNLVPGVTNNFNTQLFACGGGVPNGPGGTCLVPGPPGSTTPTLGASVSYVYMAGSNASLPVVLGAPVPLPIAGPMREQAAFTGVAADKVGFPIPVVGLDGTGNVVPYTAPVGPPGTPPSSGLLPHGANNPACTSIVPAITCADAITLTETEAPAAAGTHFQLELVDAKTGQIAQAPGTAVTLTQLNALDAADITGAGTPGDQYVVVALFDGSPASLSTSATVTLTGTLAGAAITAQTVTVTPQASLFTAVAAGPANGYTDAAAPYTKAADILNTIGATGVLAAGQGYWVTDGGNMHLVGGATYAVAGATTLTGEALDNNPNFTAGQILAVDNSTVAVAPAAANPAQAGGVWVFDPVAHTSKALAIEDGSTGYFEALGAPQAIGFVTNGYVYVDAGNTIYAIDPVASGVAPGIATDGAFFVAEEIGTLPVSGLSGNATGFDMIVSGTKLIFTDSGNNRIVSIDTASCLPGGAACTPTVIASGHPFVGLSANGANYVATDTAGQIYNITSAGVVTSLGLTGGAVKDGVVGVIGTNPLAPIPYTTQGQTANFFGSASVPTLPYNVSPFSAAGPVLTVPLAALVPDTSNATFGATAGTTMAGFGVAYIANPAPAAPLTATSYLFTDNGALRTLVP